MDNILLYAILMGLILYYSETINKRGYRGGEGEVGVGVYVGIGVFVILIGSGVIYMVLSSGKCSGNVIGDDYECSEGTLKSNSDKIKGSTDDKCCDPPAATCDGYTCLTGTTRVDNPATIIPAFGVIAILTLPASGLCRLWVFNVDIIVSLVDVYTYL